MFCDIYVTLGRWTVDSIGSNIKRLRIAAGMSQEQLAEKLGKSRAAVSQYESGKNVPRMGVIEDIAWIFGVRKSEILGEARPVSELDSDEERLVDLFRSMDALRRSALLTTAEALAAASEKEAAVPSVPRTA